MDRSQFVTRSVLAFALILAGFITMGFSRLVLPYRTARLLAAPALFAAAVLVAYLVGYAVLVAVGAREFE
jgi:hypothetical protein